MTIDGFQMEYLKLFENSNSEQWDSDHIGTVVQCTHVRREYTNKLDRYLLKEECLKNISITAN